MKASNYGKRQAASSQYTVPLPRAICRLIYVFCKVRGQKVVVRFFNNEPRYIEPMLDCLRTWSSMKHVDNATLVDAMSWEERYIMLLWLSHLMLAPFDLVSISSSSIDLSSSKLASVLEGLPSIAQVLLHTAFDYLHVSSKEREAAAIMIVRLVLRGDMQSRQLLPRVIEYALSGLKLGDHSNTSAAASAYRFSGLLSLLCGIMTVGSDDDVASYLSRIFHVCIQLATSDGPHETHVRNTAPVRKSLIKATRLCMLHALSLSARQSRTAATYDLDKMLEETIQYLLDSLSDKDTPVRMIASKSLGMITLTLETAMSAEVIEAVLSSLEENMLLEDSNGKTFAITELPTEEIKNYKKNVGAVNPLQWHGLMLTLGHLLFRRSPPPQQLPDIIAALIAGLEFEQRSNVGTSVGVGVRDAACFGIWSLARKYSKNEIDKVDASQLLPVLDEGNSALVTKHSALQVLANQLVLSACLDPSGNIRRGSSAALQELIGRHPDTILHGIPVVQVVDYHAVARRSRAMVEVSLHAAKLDTIYLNSLLMALLGWRGTRSADADSRRWAAEAVFKLTGLVSLGDAVAHCKRLETRATKLKASNAGSNAATRHGILLGLSAILDQTWTSYSQGPNIDSSVSAVLHSALNDLDLLTGSIFGRVTRDLELVFEATSVLVAVLAKFSSVIDSNILSTLLPVVERCLTGSEKDQVVQESTRAFVTLFSHLNYSAQAQLLKRWLHTDQSTPAEFRSRGRIDGVGAMFWLLPSEKAIFMRSAALEYIEGFVKKGQWPIETRINAMQSLKNVLIAGAELYGPGQMDISTTQTNSIAEVILTGLNDYTIDQRGDIGSTLRLKAIEAAGAFLHAMEINSAPALSLIQVIARLAAEKLDKLRLQAWILLQIYWKQQPDFPTLEKTSTHLADVSSVEYYFQLFQLLDVEWLQKYVIVGMVSSAAAGTEDIGRASRSALATHMLHEMSQLPRPATGSITDRLIEHLEQTVADDREAVPAMEILAFVIEQQLAEVTSAPSKALRVMQKAHTPTSSIQRLEAAIKVYSALCNTDQKNVAIDKLTRLLLHRYPKIRGNAADALHLHTNEESLVLCDWAVPVTDLKPVVLRLRKELKVV
jgi:tubulin-specific chaperone D